MDRVLLTGTPLLLPRIGMWDSEKVGLTAPPIKTKKGYNIFKKVILTRSALSDYFNFNLIHLGGVWGMLGFYTSKVEKWKNLETNVKQ
jgi:hypothetical protein